MHHTNNWEKVGVFSKTYRLDTIKRKKKNKSIVVHYFFCTFARFSVERSG